MKLGLIGLPMSGKTTILNALTGQQRPPTVSVPGKLEVQVAVVDVPDSRVDVLDEMYQPEKKIPARIIYADIGGLDKGIGGKDGLNGPFRNELNSMDAFLVVVRAFQSNSVPHPHETIDPQRDLETLDGEFLLADLVIVEKRIEKLQAEIERGKNRDANARELVMFEKLATVLNDEQPLRALDLSLQERQQISGYGFLTLRPRLVIVNLGDEDIDPATLITPPDDSPLIAIQGALEAEIAQLEPDDAALFMDEYGISQPVRDRIIRASYDLLSVQTFFTVGEDEVRAWPHPIGATAQQAAGVIHSDLERGFIRAEIVPYDLLIELGGINQARQVGKLQLEGKDYVMRDGDVMNVRFNV